MQMPFKGAVVFVGGKDTALPYSHGGAAQRLLATLLKERDLLLLEEGACFQPGVALGSVLYYGLLAAGEFKV